MNPDDRKRLVIILLAVGAGILATFLVGNYIKEDVARKTQALANEYETKKIRPLMQRVDALEEENRQMKASYGSQTAQKEGVPAAVPQVSLAVKTPPGKRATTIKIDSLSAVGGLINPGDNVDVLAQLILPNPIDPKAKPETVTAMIFQNIQVLGIGTNLQIPGQYDIQQKTPELWVTFALDPQESGLMSFAQQNGKVQLVLRSPQETEIRMLQAANWQTLSDYVLEKQGTDISGPRSRAMLEPDTEEVKPYIQIFRGGREL